MKINPMLLYQNEMPKEESKTNYFLFMLVFFCFDLLFSLAGKNKKYTLIIVGAFCLLRLLIWYLKAKPMTVFDKKATWIFWITLFSSEALLCAFLFACERSNGITTFIGLLLVVLIIYAIVFALSRLIMFISSKRKKDSFIKWLIIYFFIIGLPVVLAIDFPFVFICLSGIGYTILISVFMKYKKKQEEKDDDSVSLS